MTKLQIKVLEAIVTSYPGKPINVLDNTVFYNIPSLDFKDFNVLSHIEGMYKSVTVIPVDVSLKVILTF